MSAMEVAEVAETPEVGHVEAESCGATPSEPQAPPHMLCEICSVHERRYTCPRCLVKTCSVGCIKAHKAATGCNGRRDRTTFVLRSSFTDKQLLSDYFFLEVRTLTLPILLLRTVSTVYSLWSHLIST